jgi:large subunit ribosomal protein L34
MSKTYKPKVKKRSRTHGFLTRMKRCGGKRVIRNKRRKKRKTINVT